MTIKEIYDNVSNFTDEKREKYVKALVKQFSKFSIGSLQEFQAKWNPDKGPIAFFKEQAQVIKTCIDLELSAMGQGVRSSLGLNPLTWETEIGDKAEQ